MYAEDSFFTLSVWGQIGLIVVSALFACLALALTRILVLRRPLLIRIPVWLVAFITFVWASPQGYYTYYRMILDNLPAQSVIQAPPPPELVLALLTFTGPATLSAHSTGILGWLMLLVALWPQRRLAREDQS